MLEDQEDPKEILEEQVLVVEIKLAVEAVFLLLEVMAHQGQEVLVTQAQLQEVQW